MLRLSSPLRRSRLQSRCHGVGRVRKDMLDEAQCFAYAYDTLKLSSSQVASVGFNVGVYGCMFYQATLSSPPSVIFSVAGPVGWEHAKYQSICLGSTTSTITSTSATTSTSTSTTSSTVSTSTLTTTTSMPTSTSTSTSTKTTSTKTTSTKTDTTAMAGTMGQSVTTSTTTAGVVPVTSVDIDVAVTGTIVSSAALSTTPTTPTMTTTSMTAGTLTSQPSVTVAKASDTTTSGTQPAMAVLSGFFVFDAAAEQDVARAAAELAVSSVLGADSKQLAVSAWEIASGTRSDSLARTWMVEYTLKEALSEVPRVSAVAASMGNDGSLVAALEGALVTVGVQLVPGSVMVGSASVVTVESTQTSVAAETDTTRTTTATATTGTAFGALSPQLRGSARSNKGASTVLLGLLAAAGALLAACCAGFVGSSCRRRKHREVMPALDPVVFSAWDASLPNRAAGVRVDGVATPPGSSKQSSDQASTPKFGYDSELTAPTKDSSVVLYHPPSFAALVMQQKAGAAGSQPTGALSVRG